MTRPSSTDRSILSRRAALAAAGATAASLALPSFVGRAVAAKLPALTLYGPPAGPSVTLAHAVASGAFADIAETAAFKVWRNPDEMRAGLTSGTMQALILPVQVAANLYNRGMGVRLLNVMTTGLLYIVAADPGLSSIPALKGKSLAVPFRNDMPDLVLARLLAHHGMVPGTDITLESAGSPIEAIQLLMAGRVDAVLSTEPAVSAAILRGAAGGKTVQRVIDVQQAWAEATGGSAVLPQAGMALTAPFIDANPGIADALQAIVEKAVESVNADPARAAADATEALEMPAPILAASLSTSNLVARRASAARPDIEAMLSTLAEADAGIIGGKLPDDGFYL
jgi:NitT/TauT family transport system substrate-binding protein